MDFLHTNEERIRDLFQGAGAEFTQFCDALIRTHAAALGCPDADIETTGVVDDPDGGVDTKLRREILNDNTGWFGEKTAWQYKAKTFENVEKEFSRLLIGSYLQECVKEGHAYRLTVADSLTSEQRSKWEQRLSQQVSIINPNAPVPRVVTAADLAALANRYPAFILRKFQLAELGLAVHLSSWKASVSASTPTFVAVPKWKPVQDNLISHLRFDHNVPSVLLTVQGEAGVGKSRLAYETIATLPGAEGLVLYCEGPSNAIDLVRLLANQTDTRAIVVADECGAEERLKLLTLGDGHRARIRIIAIDNSQVRANGRLPELTLENMSPESLREVLSINFPAVSSERIHRYASLAEGFPRFAADLCIHDTDIDPGGRLDSALGNVSAYLSARLSETQWRALQALALVTKIGFRGDVSPELDQLCQSLHLSRAEIEHDLKNIHQGPGFAARGSRYFYVTPEVVARVAFDAAWRSWAADDPVEFLQSFPTTLVQSLLNRVRKSASEEVRRCCAAFFRTWVRSVTLEQLTSLQIMNRLVALVEMYPKEYLPSIRRLLESHDLNKIKAITGDSRSGEWGPRRKLVWLLEGLVQFPEHFDDSEVCLLRLAMAESELSIGNNATAIWQQLYRLGLSGTATSFQERFRRLEQRAHDTDLAIRRLSLDAANVAIMLTGMRTSGPATVAGRIPPSEWYPHSWKEQQDALRSVVKLLGELIRSDQVLRPRASEILIQHTRSLIGQDLIQEIQTSFDHVDLTDHERAQLLGAIDDFLVYDANRASDETNPGSSNDEQETQEVIDPSWRLIVDTARAWRDALIGTSLHGRLVAVIGRQGFDSVRYKDESGWKKQVDKLAEELLANADALATELPWLLSGDVPSAAELGMSLGESDSSAQLLERLLTSAVRMQQRGFVRGYIHSLLEAHPEHSSLLNLWLDAQEDASPEAIADFALSAGAKGRALERILRLYDQGKLPIAFLHVRNFFRRDRISLDDLSLLLTRLATAARNGDASAVQIGLDSLSLHMPYDPKDQPLDVFASHPEIVHLAWELLEIAARLDRATLVHWDSIILNLTPLDSLRAARFACNIMFSDDFSRRLECERVLGGIAKRFPGELMQALGECMLDPKRGILFYVGNYRKLFAAIPNGIIISWLEKNGVEGARKIARHLPSPAIKDNRAIVPALTEWVLTKFEDDERTFREFCTGSHSFQWYSGNIAAQHEAEAETARQFLSHHLRRIREWADIEERGASADAKTWRRWSEEIALPE